MSITAINSIGPLILIAIICAIAIYAGVRWLRAETPQQRNWWRLRAAAVFALAVVIALNQYVLHHRWPG